MKRFTNLRFVRFLALGGANTLATYLIYLLCLHWMRYPFAFSISTVVGILVAYAGNAIFVFRIPLSWSDLSRYPLLYLIQYLLGMLLLFIEVHAFGFDERWAPLLNVAIMVPFTYLMNRLILMRGRENA